MNTDNGKPGDQVASEALSQLDRLLETLVLQSKTTGMAQSSNSSSSTTATSPQEPNTVSSLLSTLAGGVQSFLPNGQGLAGLTGTGPGSWWQSLLSPLVGGLLGLFKRGDDTETASPMPYIRPAPLAMEYAWTGSGEDGLLPFDYDSAGRPRPVRSENPPSQTPITIQVQAMDSRSFLDHRDDIADAVRRALLESHPLNDTLSEV
jgi:hypothetical protein